MVIDNDLFISKLVFKTHKSPVLLLFRILCLICFLDLILLLIFLFVDFIDFTNNGLISIYTLEENVVIGFMILHVLLFLYLFLYWFVDYYKIYEGKIIHRDGILFKKKELYIIDDINSIKLKQSFLGRIFDYGNIVIYYNENKVIFKFLHYPEEFINIIELFKGYDKIIKK